MKNPMSKTYYNLLFKNYPQYEVLRQELLKLFFRKALTERGIVDCYVDLNSYLSSLYKRNDYVYDGYGSITASIINFAAHIRAFFASRFSIRTRIFLIYGTTRPESSVRFLNEYDAHNEMDRNAKSNIRDIITEDLNILSIIAPYIPEVYFISDINTEPSVIIRSIIKDQSRKGFKNPRLIFSKDLMAYQLVATCPNTHIIRTKKTMQGDKTYTISYFDFYKKLSRELNSKTPIGEGISPELYSLYLTLAGCKDRGIRGLINYPKTNSVITETINSGLMLNGYNPSFAVNPESFGIFLNFIDKLSEVEMCNRYCAIDIIYQSDLYRLSPYYSNINKGIVDLYDPEAVKQINNQYFKDYPLDLNVL